MINNIMDLIDPREMEWELIPFRFEPLPSLQELLRELEAQEDKSLRGKLDGSSC